MINVAPPAWSTLAATQDGMVTAAQAMAAGLSRADVYTRVRRGEWRRLHRAVFLTDADLHPVTPVRAAIRAAVLATGRPAVACEVSAGYLHGLGGLPSVEQRPPDVSTDRGTRSSRGGRIRARQLHLRGDEITIVDGIPTTTLPRTLGDLALALPRLEAVAVLDSALHSHRLRVTDFDELAAIVRGRAGAADARARLAEADGRCASPLETRVRLICADGGVPPDELQATILDDYGNVLGIADMVWHDAKLIVEADGVAVHGGLEPAYRDRWRSNGMRSAGYSIIRFTWADTFRPAYIVSTIKKSLRSAA